MQQRVRPGLCGKMDSFLDISLIFHISRSFSVDYYIRELFKNGARSKYPRNKDKNRKRQESAN
jgi:hypothetical protein